MKSCKLLSLKSHIRVTGSRSHFINPMIDPSCTNLWLKASYSVQPVGAITTYPDYEGPIMATLSLFTAGPKASLKSGVYFPIAAPNQIMNPTANDTRLDC